MSEPIAKTQAAPFTYQDYLGLLRQLRDGGYSFASFTEAQKLIDDKKIFVLVRHDVDLDLAKALQLAELESSFSISATYFFMVRTDHYNVFSRGGSEIVSQILGLGHHLGLHFDCAAYPEDSDLNHLSQASAKEAFLLQDWFGKPISMVSYHRPNDIILSGELSLSKPLQHTYMPVFTKEVTYFSDSRGEWKYGHPLRSLAFKQGRPLQILFHPIWWNDDPVTPYEALLSFIDRRHRALERSLAQNCIIFRPAHLQAEK